MLNPEEAFFFPPFNAAAAAAAPAVPRRNPEAPDAADADADAESTLWRIFRQLMIPRGGRGGGGGGDGNGRGRSHSEGFNPKGPPKL